MQGCIAPSEIPGISSIEASNFGAVAEDIIYADFFAQYFGGPNDFFRDSNNPSSYLYFLAVNNPHFSQSVQSDYYRRLRTEGLERIPDFLVHKSVEKAFYEVKPDSASGMRAGIDKVGVLKAVYSFYRLPYMAGIIFTPRDHTIALLGKAIQATLRVRRAAAGLIVYKVCVESNGTIELATLALLLRYIVQQINRQKGTGRFEPVDLQPALKDQQLGDFARALGLATGAIAVGIGVKATWRHFWHAVINRFAIRGTTAVALTAADGPLPVGDLIAVGMALWTIVDIIRLSDELWSEADKIAHQGM